MPLLGTRGAASARGFGFTALTGIGGPYWIGVLTGATTDQGYGITVDSSGNVYATGRTDSQSAGSYDVLITKYNNSGVIQWQRILGGASADVGRGIAVDSSGNVYITGDYGSGALIAKYDNNGTIQWQRALTGDIHGMGIAVDSSSNVYIVGYTTTQGSGGNDFVIAKYNTSGTIQWQRVLGDINSDVGNGIAVDSSGNVYVVGNTTTTNGGVQIAKYDTNGTIQWQRQLKSSSNDAGYSIAVDSSGNVYITGNTSSGVDILIAKYNTSGAIQWQQVLGGASNDVGFAIAVDSSGNVYITGYTSSQSGGSYNYVPIAKYNNSGTIQWQRYINGASTSSLGQSISVDISGNVYITGYTAAPSGGVNNDVLIAKLPSDGSKTGTYSVGGGSFTYAASTLTAAASSLSSYGSSLTSSTSTLTAITPTLTSATSTLTSSVTTI
jgi:uncharacterized delta-60 repeat protein